jgi:hypothetical protein
MVTREERDSAVDEISYRMIDVLYSWMINERANLDGFIADPENHVDFNPYLVIDFDALSQRSVGLGNVADALLLVSQYKKGDESVTRTMHDIAIESVPVIIWKRLYDWMDKRANDMQKFLQDAQSNPPVPLDDYKQFVSFDTGKYLAELQMYISSRDGLAIVIQYAEEEGLGIGS